MPRRCWPIPGRPRTGTRRCPAPEPRCSPTSPASLSRGFRGADRLYGFAHHSVSTTFLASSTGLRRRYTQPTGCGGDQRQTRRRQRLGGCRHARLRRCANGFAARAAVDAAGLGAAQRRAARRALRDDHAAVDGGRHDDLPGVVDDRPRRAGGPHRVLGARRRDPGGGAADRPAADAVLRSDGAGAGVYAVRRGEQLLGDGVGVRQRDGHRPGRLDPRRGDQRAGLSAGHGRQIRRAGRRGRRQHGDDRRVGRTRRHDRRRPSAACC